MNEIALGCLLAALAMSAVLLGCASTTTGSRVSAEADVGTGPADQPPRWAIALHGGAGTIRRESDPERVAAYEAALARALQTGVDMLEAGASSLDAVEAVVRVMEDESLFNAGRGAVFTANATHELDASIMDGRDRAAGGVAAVRTVKNPISLARLVMTETRHVLLASDGAEAFADEMKVERVEPTYFDTPRRYQQLQRALTRQAEGNELGATQLRSEDDALKDRSTVGCVALDAEGNLAAATSTGGMTAKRWGRVGDSPIIGAGTYADNATCAVSGTGTGEEFIRHAVGFHVASLIAHRDLSLQDAAETVVFEVLREGDGGVIAIDRRGEIAMPFNTRGMFRGAANADGRFEIAIWDEMRDPRAALADDS